MIRKTINITDIIKVTLREIKSDRLAQSYFAENG
mgnify:CR=1 FL=1